MRLNIIPPRGKMDPWCVVSRWDGTDVLFGYAVRHPTTGDRSWVSTSAIKELNAAAGSALTKSGQTYDLGRRIERQDIPKEGEEAWVAFVLALGHDLDELEVLPPCVANLATDRKWVSACKVARHLGLIPPRRIPQEVTEFLDQHFAVYRRLRTPVR